LLGVVVGLLGVVVDLDADEWCDELHAASKTVTPTADARRFTIRPRLPPRAGSMLA
jgi:hypothetical protein